jgi:ribonuclease D
LYKQVFPTETGRGGLTHISKRFLMRSLCKGEQQSNWEKRPLRLMQIHYAALDSYCEILIWDQMRIEAAEQGVQLTSFLTDLNDSGKGRKKKGKEEGL